MRQIIVVVDEDPAVVAYLAHWLRQDSHAVCGGSAL